MPYEVVQSGDFRAKLKKATKSSRYPTHYMKPVVWTLSRGPTIGAKGRKNVWVIKVLWSPLIATIYYAIDEAKKKVHLLDVDI